MSTNVEHQKSVEALRRMQEEDKKVPWSDDPSFLNFPTSRDSHHRGIAMWAGALTPKLGAHRRGPVSNR